MAIELDPKTQPKPGAESDDFESLTDSLLKEDVRNMPKDAEKLTLAPEPPASAPEATPAETEAALASSAAEAPEAAAAMPVAEVPPEVLPEVPAVELPVPREGMQTVADNLGIPLYTELKDWAKIPPVFNANDDIIVTELLRGDQVRVGVTAKGVAFLGSKTELFADTPESLPWKVVREAEVHGKLAGMFHEVDSVLFGVICYTPEPKFYFYDLMVDGKYMADYMLIRLQNLTGLMRTPILYRGRYNSLALKHAGTESQVFKGQPNAGIVVKSVNYLNDPRIGRKIVAVYS